MSLFPQPRSFRRLFKQLFAGILKRQNGVEQEVFQSEVIQQLKKLEAKIKAVTREMERHAKQKQ